MIREHFIYSLLLLSSVGFAIAMEQRAIVVQPKQDRLSALSQEELDTFHKRLVQVVEQDRKDEADREAHKLTQEDFNKRRSVIISNAQFAQQIDNFCVARLKYYEALNPAITARAAAEKLQQDLRKHWKRRFKVFYKATYVDWHHHEDALTVFTNASVDQCIAQRPELAILASAGCCVIL